MIDTKENIIDTQYVRKKFYVSEMNHDYFLSWFIRFKYQNMKNVVNPSYNEIFIANRGENQTYRMMSIGMYIGFRVYASKYQIYIDILRREEIIQKLEFFPEMKEIKSYQEILTFCSSVQKKMKEWFPKELHDLPFIGGFQNRKLEETVKELGVFYLPEIAVYGCEMEMNLFSIYDKYDISYGEVLFKGKREEVLQMKFSPEKETYMTKLRKGIEAFAENGIDKMVISKKCVITTKEDIDIWEISNYLLKNYYQQYFYVFETDKDKQWLGVSPEVLITDDEHNFISKPLAGTYEKGEDEQENQEIKERLLKDPKETKEHNVVVELMLEDIKNSDFKKVELIDSREIVETPYVFHLKSQIQVEKTRHLNVFDLLQHIYPPATIWGIPREKCGEQIYEIEDFDREYFTGFYGIFNLEDFAEFALLIRSASVKNKEISIYAGGGIIELSDPIYEWNETNAKMNPFINYFGKSNMPRKDEVRK